MIRTVFVSAAAAAVIICTTGPAPAQAPAPPPATVSGKVIWREKIMLPPSRVTVRLQDVSRLDAPAIVVAEQVIDNVRTPPVAFNLSYDPALIVENHRYSVSASVETDGVLRFITDSHTPVITNGVSSVQLVAKSSKR